MLFMILGNRTNRYADSVPVLSLVLTGVKQAYDRALERHFRRQTAVFVRSVAHVSHGSITIIKCIHMLLKSVKISMNLKSRINLLSVSTDSAHFRL